MSILLNHTITICPLRKNYAKKRFSVVNNNKVILGKHFSWCGLNFNTQQNLHFINKAEWLWNKKHGYYFSILNFNSTKYLGEITIDSINHNNKSANVSYWVGEEAQGKGIATQALCLLKTWAKTHTNLDYLQIVMHTNNLKSKAVAERAGCNYIKEKKHCRFGNGTIGNIYEYHLPL